MTPQDHLLRRLCQGEDVPAAELERAFGGERWLAALLRERGLPRRFTPAEPVEICPGCDSPFALYGRDGREWLAVSPEAGGRADQTLRVMRGRLDEYRQSGSYGTLLYFSAAFPAAALGSRVRALYDWLHASSALGYSQSIDLDAGVPASPLPSGSEALELNAFFRELAQYAHLGLHDMLRNTVEYALRRWEQQRMPQIWLEYAMERILEIVWRHGGDTLPLSQCARQVEDAFYDARSMAELASSLGVLIHATPETMPLRPKVDSPGYFGQIDAYLHNHLSEPLPLQELSNLFAISQAYMSRLFKKYTGQTYNQYLTALRMERAKLLMRENPQLYVKDVAELVGYRDPFYFGRVFRRREGMTPAEYMRR